MGYMVIPGFEKFEIDEEGVVRNAKTKRETKPYHTSEKTGPMVHLLDTKTGTEGRLSVIKLVADIFKIKLRGWDLDPSKITVKAAVDRKPRLTDAERKAREDLKAARTAELACRRAAAKIERAKLAAEKKAAAPKTEAQEKADAITEQYRAISDKPEELEIPSDLEPGVIFKMKKHEFTNADGASFIGYKVVKKVRPKPVAASV